MKLKNKKRLFEEFKSIPDFRAHRHKIQYPLEEILFLTLFALLQGVSEYRAIHTWCIYNANSKIFKRIFDKRHVRVPSFSTLHMILSNVDNNALELIFREFFKRYSTYDNLAVDGKWLNGSDISGQYVEESHKAVLNILDKDKKIVVGHQLLCNGHSHQKTFMNYHH